MANQTSIVAVLQNFKEPGAGIVWLNLADAEQVDIEDLDAVGHGDADEFGVAAYRIGTRHQALSIAGGPDAINTALMFSDIPGSENVLV